jgi:Leucine-rich repeat (LRR) protein
LDDNDLVGCFPPSFTNLFGQLSIQNFTGNPCLWDNGNFSNFCNNINPCILMEASADTMICLGQSTTIEAFGGVGYVWSTGSTANSLSVTPSANTMYYVTMTNATGCVVTDSVEVRIAWDYDALMSIYNNTDGSNWTNNSGWGQDCSFCYWYGVTCDETWNVSQVDFSVNNLTGALPADLLNLPNLQYLDLGNNNLPGLLVNLPHIPYMALNSNQIKGNIPTSINTLTNLTDLHLQGNQLDGTLPLELTTLTNLQNLYLQGNSLGGDIIAELSNLGNLQVLSLGDNLFTGTLPDALGGGLLIGIVCQ